MVRRARAEASAWIVRLHGPHRTPELEAGFRAWLAAHPENARQFERVTEVWDAGAVPVPGMPRVAHRPQRRPPRGWWLPAAVMSVVAGVAFWGADALWLNPAYATGLGEQRIVLLPDGSRVTLNTESRVTVSYHGRMRRVSIDHGEAFFEVAKNPFRPFQVTAGEQVIEALGTSFDVRRESQLLAVTLVAGRVVVSGIEPAVRSAAASKGGPAFVRITLSEGQRLRVKAHALPDLDRPSIEAVTAWRRGELMLDSTPLSAAIQEMNRYDWRQLVIDDPKIASTRISGIYHAGDNEVFADMVARLYGFSVERQDTAIHLGTRKVTPPGGT